MYIPLEFIELTELVKECNGLRNVLLQIKKVTDKTNEGNFETQSKLIAVICEKALKNKPPILWVSSYNQGKSPIDFWANS